MKFGVPSTPSLPSTEDLTGTVARRTERYNSTSPQSRPFRWLLAVSPTMKQEKA